MSEAREPLDLRLVPAAASAWAAAWCGEAARAPGSVLVLAGAACVLVAIAVALRRRLGRAAGGLVLALVVVVVVLASGAAHRVAVGAGGLAALVDDHAIVTVTGVLRTDAVPAPTPWDPTLPRSRYTVAVDQLQARGTTRSAAARLLVTAAGPARGLVRGATVRVTGRLAPTDLAGAGTVGSLSARTVEVLSAAAGVDAVVAQLRTGLLDLTDGLDPQARGLVPGMTLGDTSRVPAAVTADMRAVGLTHLTAVSGTHVAVVLLVVGSLALRLRAPRAVRAGAAGLAIGGFVLLVHPEPSVLRAALMGVVAIGALLLGRASRAMPALSATVVALLVAEPGLVRSVGFTLSVVATAAIVLLAVPASRALPDLPTALVQAIAVPLAAQSACGPILVLLNPNVSLWAVPANLAAAPAVLPATILGLLATLLHPLSVPVAGVLAHGSGVATGWIAGVASVGAGLPGARLGWTPGWPGAVGLAALTALAWLLASRALRTRRDGSADRDPPAAARPGGARRRARARVTGLRSGRLVPCPPPRADRHRPP